MALVDQMQRGLGITFMRDDWPRANFRGRASAKNPRAGCHLEGADTDRECSVEECCCSLQIATGSQRDVDDLPCWSIARQT